MLRVSVMTRKPGPRRQLSAPRLRGASRLQRSTAPQLLRQDDISTLNALEQQGFSDRMIERFFRPLVGGIQLDPSLQTSRRMFDVILRSLIEGDVAVPALGMGAIPAQLADRLPAGVNHLDTKVVAVAPGELEIGGLEGPQPHGGIGRLGP